MAKDENNVNYIQEKLDDVLSYVHKIDKELAVSNNNLKLHASHNEKIYNSLHTELQRLNEILEVNTESLNQHIARTELLENRADILEELIRKIDYRLSPIEIERIEKAAINKFKNEKLIKIGKIVGAIATVIATAVGALFSIK